MTRSLLVLAAVACFAAAPVIAQQPANAPAKPAAHAAQPVAAGPRLQQDFHSYQPALAHQTATSSNAAAAAADNVVITISTLGLILLGVLLILLLT